MAGLDTDKAFDMGIGYLALGWVGTVCSWFLLMKVGRRRIYNTGLFILAVIMIVIAILDCAPNYINRPSVIWAQSSLMVGFAFLCQIFRPDSYQARLHFLSFANKLPDLVGA